MTHARLAYYNEIDPYCAQWLRNLIAAGHIAPGDVDERSIEDVRPSDLRGYRQCHFFAGLGGWSYALRLAGWPDDLPVWTGSCPCQPFSAAGARAGVKDRRHLWPAFAHLIRFSSPGVIFGEQVAAAAGREWFAAVRADLEAMGYAATAFDLSVAGVNAPHIRQRLYFVADSVRGGRQEGDVQSSARGQRPAEERASQRSDAGSLGNTNAPGRGKLAQRNSAAQDGQKVPQRANADGSGYWDACEWILCRDGKRRPVEPGTFPLAHGIPNRVGRLRAYGNAIVPQITAEFIRAYREC